MIIESCALFHFKIKGMIFDYVQRNRKNSIVCTFEIHATNEEGERFLADEDNYNDAFFAGRNIFILIRTKELEDASKLCIQEQQIEMSSGQVETPV